MSELVLGGEGFAATTLLLLSHMAQAGGVMAPKDTQMMPTAICTFPGCGHVRWLHGPYPENPCNAKGCPCIRGWSFEVAVYDSPDKIGNQHG